VAHSSAYSSLEPSTFKISAMKLYRSSICAWR
jgi:hypothetical protein